MTQKQHAPLVRYDYKSKIRNIRIQNDYMLAKTIPMFSYEGLPATIPPHQLERILQTYGFAFITEVDGALWAFGGTRGGEMDAYGEPRFITINNVFLNFNAILDIKKDGVLIKNDDMFMGMLPMYDRANTMMVENDTSIMLWQYNSRIQRLLSAPDDKTRESAQEYINKIIAGELGVVGESPAFDGLSMESPRSGGVAIQDHIELKQYIQGTLYNEVGISAQFNMKRERLISAEVEQTEDSLFPFVYSMMKNRVAGIERLNEMYGLQVDVDFGSIWNIRNNEVLNEMYDEEEAPEEINLDPVATDGDGDGGEGEGDAPAPTPLSEGSAAEEEAEEEVESTVDADIDAPEDAPEFVSGDTESEEVEEELEGEDDESGSMESVDETGDAMEVSESDEPETEAEELAEDEEAEPEESEDEIAEDSNVEDEEEDVVDAELSPEEVEDDEEAESEEESEPEDDESEEEVTEEAESEGDDSEDEVADEEESEGEDESEDAESEEDEVEEGSDDNEAVETVETEEDEEPEETEGAESEEDEDSEEVEDDEEKKKEDE